MLVEIEAIGESGLSVELGSVEATQANVNAYLEAVSNGLPLYTETGLAPPLYLSATSLGLLLRELRLPAGTVHSLQETEVSLPIAIGRTFEVSAHLERPRMRARLKFLTVNCDIHSLDGQRAMTSKSTVMLAENSPAEEPAPRQSVAPAHADGTRASELPPVARTITQEQLTAYALASGDDNPLHLDAEFAANTRFGGVIAHGMLTLSFIDQMIAASLGTSWLETGSLRVRFKGAAYLGDVVESWGNTGRNGEFAVGVCNSVTGQELVSGTATLRNS